MDTRSTHRGPDREHPVAPRVVIFDRGADTRVEVLQLPAATDLGQVICHSGLSWRITATRTHHRVLVAEPV